MSINMDPNNLERAAEAIREIQQSPHAKLIYQGIIEKERALGYSNQAALERDKAEYLKIKADETRKSMAFEKEQKKSVEEHRDLIARKRYTDQLKEKEAIQDTINKKNEQSIRVQEEIRQKSMEKQMEAQLKLEEKKAEMVGKAKALAFRQNFDLKIQQIIKQEEQRRETLKELAALTFDNVAQSAKYIQNNKGLAVSIAVYTALISSAFFISRSSINLALKFLEARLGQPTLIRETSRPTFKNYFSKQFSRVASISTAKSSQQRIFKDVILPIQLENALQSFSFSIVNKKRNIVPLRNMLIYGPPGTGKTLFAKKLAHSSGMDYAIMAGSDIAPLKESGVDQINKMFDWAEKSSKGILIFVDEGDAFLRNRDDQRMSENVRNCINTFLYRTGSPSHNVMFIVATNYPEAIDKALNDRVDNYIYFPLPGAEERLRLVNLFFVKYFDHKFSLMEELRNLWRRPSSLFFRPKLIKQDPSIDDAFLKEIANKLEGFSGREIEKFVIACHNSAFFSKEPSIDRNTIEFVLKSTLTQHKEKQAWTTANL